MPATARPWEDDERRNWEYGDIRLHVVKHLYAGGSLQAIVLRGQLMLEFALTRLLTNDAGRVSERGINRLSFSRKIQLAAHKGLVNERVKDILITINRLRNVHVHEAAADSTYRQIHALWKVARLAGVKHRYHSMRDEAEMDKQVEALGKLADELFSPEHGLVDLLAELFCHLVFWNYESFDIEALVRTEPGPQC